jgi:hypothetical protein
MSNRINDIFNSMGGERALITQQVTAYRDYSQAEVFFRLAWEKSQRVDLLRERFAGRRIGKICVGASLAAAGLQLPGVDIVALPKDYFERALGDGLPALLQELAGAIVVINNNDFSHGQSAPGIMRAYGQADDTVFLGWDYDNHHWMDASLMLAAHTDLYFPAHQENMFLLSRMNALTCGPVPCATVQWSQRFLEQHLEQMLRTGRSDQPLGMHFFYQAFAFRNQTVVTLGKHFPNVGFADRAFQVKTPEDRLTEWIAHKAHWIVPVLNDVPIRIFDALASGGVPLLPEALRFLAPVASLPREHVVFYGPQDILEPQAVVARANAVFDQGGAEGIVARHRLGVNQHHAADRLSRMLDMARERLEFAPLIG